MISVACSAIKPRGCGRPCLVRVIDHDDAGAETIGGGLAEGQLAQIDGRHRLAAIIEQAGDTARALAGIFFNSTSGRTSSDWLASMHVSVPTKLEKQEQHGR